MNNKLYFVLDYFLFENLRKCDNSLFFDRQPPYPCYLLHLWHSCSGETSVGRPPRPENRAAKEVEVIER